MVAKPRHGPPSRRPRNAGRRLVDQTLHFTSARSRSTAAAIAAERVAGGKRDAHHASSRLSRSGLIVTEITTAAAPRRLPTLARVDLVARAMAASMLIPSYTCLNAIINANIDRHIAGAYRCLRRRCAA